MTASIRTGSPALATCTAFFNVGPSSFGSLTGPKLAPNPLPYDTLSAFIRSSNGPMPPFREAILPTADLQDIYAYLQSIPPAPDYKSIPLLSNK